MGFSLNQDSPKSLKRCKFFSSTLKDAFANCHTFRENSSTQSSDEEDVIDDYEDEEEVFVSIVISKYMESKCRRKTTISSDKFNWTFSSTAGDLFISARQMQQKENSEDEEKEEEDFFSVGTRLSRCTSARSLEAYATAKTTFSRSSSLNRIEFQDFPRHSVIHDFSHCQGWPFGLCRKLLLLPPLPKSPSDSWTWRKSARMIKIH